MGSFIPEASEVDFTVIELFDSEAISKVNMHWASIGSPSQTLSELTDHSERPDHQVPEPYRLAAERLFEDVGLIGWPGGGV